jgi:predicted chitinase
MNVDTLVTAMPGLSRPLATSYLPQMEAAMREFGITNVHRCRMWLAQVGHESVSLRYFEEIASGAAYEGRQDLGNTQPGDGKRFKGRGPIQLTGRANYTAAGKALGLDLVGNPAMAAQPQHAFRVSAWWWKNHGLNEISDKDDVSAATRRINGGLNGLADRQTRYNRVKPLGNAVLVGAGAPPAPPKPPPGGGTAPPLHVDYFSAAHNARVADVKTWQAQMRARGWKAGGALLAADGIFGAKSEEVCRAFQREKGLGADGKVGPKTWGAAWTAAVT